MRPVCLLSLSAILVGCHALRPQLPALVFEGRYDVAARSVGTDGAHTRGVLTLSVGLRVASSPPSEPAHAGVMTDGGSRAPAPCVSPALCLLERRWRERESLRLVRAELSR